MNPLSSSVINRLLFWWGEHVYRFPWVIIILTVLLTAASTYYSSNNLGINTNSADMLSPDLPFQKNSKRIEEEFPQDARVIILVVEALTPEETSQAANTLAEKLSQKKDSFSSVYIPTENDFFRQQALLFLEQDQLEELAEKLTRTQPFIGYLAQHYSLQGLFDIVTKALEADEQTLPTDLDPLLLAINNAITNQLNDQPQQLSWQNLLASDHLNTETNRTLVIAKPRLNFDEIMAAEQALTAARETANLIMQDNTSIRIRITGEAALEHEELESVSEGVVVSAIASLLLVCGSLWLGLRSFKLMLATLIVLILGLLLTAGFATVAVGHLNIISIAFAVLYIGLGVDYAIHVNLHYRECRAQGLENAAALTESVQIVGFPIFLCAVTTSLGFLAFVPTDFSGVSEFGIISAGGMIIGLFVSLTVLPALITVFSIKNVKPIGTGFSLGSLATLPFRYSTLIRVFTIIIAIAASTLLTQLVFDSNPINLRDPNSESVSTIKELLKSQTESPFALLTLAPNQKDAEKLAQQLEQLPSVHQTIFLGNLVAENQHEKLEIIEELDLILGNQLSNFKTELTDTQPEQALLTFNKSISEILKKPETNATRATLEKLQNNISLILQNPNNHAEPYQALEKKILDLLPYTMERLQSSMTAEPYDLADIPDYIRSHWLSKNGFYKVHITPEYDQNDIQNLKQFVSEVQAAAPYSSGLPVADQASGAAIAKAFIQAFSGAIIAIFLLLLIILRDLKSTLLVIGPLLLAALLTGATNVLLDNPFNFANVIALPLLMGMGVDSSIHIMQRLKSGLSSQSEILQSSTARGVFFSSLTTLFSFSSLAFTPHVGTSSMGLLLAVGIFFTLVCTLIVLPAFYCKES